MTSQPWMKFFPSDWRSDPRLRMCSLAARGLWMEMLMLMHEAEPYGHLLVAGIAPSPQQLALLTGATAAEVPPLLAELEAAAVFSLTGKGVIYSRRMTRDEKKARLAVRNGKKGGNPNLCNTKENPPPDNPPDKPHVNGEDKPHTRAFQTPESEDSVASATAPPEAGAEDAPSLKSELFGRCLVWLIATTGRDEKSLRPMIGRWIGKHGEGAVLAAIVCAQRESAVSPVSFIEGVLKSGSKQHGQANGSKHDRLIHGFARAFGDLLDTGPADTGGERRELAIGYH